VFVNALKLASAYTQPVIISKRFESGKIECGCAAFIILNADGWILTASHVMKTLHLFQQQKIAHEDNERSRVAIQNDPNINDKQKRRKISQILKDPNRITNIAFWWGHDGIQYSDIIGNDLLDLAVCKLTGAPQISESSYPIFKNLPENLEYLPVGRSLCRLGFPFHEIHATFDEQNGNFTLAPDTLPIPRFPNDGILTRGVWIINPNNQSKARFIETSTPGLRGQSGGPIFDVNGHIWGVQSKTINLPLGFSPTIKVNNKEVIEHQFLNVGLGVHAFEIIKFLQENNIKINISNDS